MADQKTFYVTTPIFYPNAKLHMGHAYVTTLSDIIARSHRMMGESTYFLTGSDENTQKMVEAARKNGQEPMAFLNGIVDKFRALFKELDISYDQFIRTTDQEQHWPGAQELWKRLEASDDLYKNEYEGLYCVGHEAFITEKDLIEGKCPDHGTVPELLKEENYFFRLSRYTDSIRQMIVDDELKILPATRKREILALLDEGLQDVSFSRPRKTDWPAGLGVPVPGDDSQVMYVWCDALSNYITALGFGQQNDTKYREFWEANPNRIHVIGKDILRFHAAIWPAMLMSAGVPLPSTILVHGMILSGGQKMSKTLGNVIDPDELLAEYGTDAVRYFLARYVSPFEDGDLTREHFKEAYNADLANGLGNLVSRVMNLAQTYLSESPIKNPNRRVEDPSLENAIKAFDIQMYTNLIWMKIALVDQKITSKKPFSVIKEDKELGTEMIKDLVGDVYILGKMIEPIMPNSSKKIISAVVENKKPENLFPRKD